jgi:hypothetical protein
MRSTASPAAHARALPPKVEPWLPGVAHRRLFRGQHSADGKTAQALGKGDGVRLRAAAIAAEEAPEQADAGLHLVDEKQGSAGVGDRAQPGEEAGRRGDHAAFALHGLDDDRADVGTHRAFDRVSVAVRDMRHRPEGTGPRGTSASPSSTASRASYVERVVERDDAHPLFLPLVIRVMTSELSIASLASVPELQKRRA